jgi:hypothetical protein
VQGNVAVILPDGKLDFEAGHLVPEGVELEPLSAESVAVGRWVLAGSPSGKTFPSRTGAVEFFGRLETLSRIPEPYSTGWMLIVAAMTERECEETSTLSTRGGASSPFGRYMAMRLDGESHNMAIVLASRQFPGVKTDSTFNEGRCNGNQFESNPARGDYYRRIAESAGVNVTGKTYLTSLAEFPGDPEAWISDRHDVLAVAERKGLRVEGAVNYTPPERAPLPDIEIAPDIIDREVDDIMAADPGQRRGDVAERVYELRTGRVDPNPLRVSDHHEPS